MYVQYSLSLSSPAVTVRPNSIKAGVLFEGVAAFLQDEVGVPVQTLFAFDRHAHHATVKLSILFVTVVWPSRKKENNENRTEESEQCVLSGQWADGDCGEVYQLRRSSRCSLQGRNTGSWSDGDPSCKCPHFDKDQACRERLCQKKTIDE